jgi:CHAT domain-containing protein
LIQPIADLLPNQPQEHVAFIPQGELLLVPFAALKDVNGKYLIEQHTITTAPSIQVLDLLYQREQQIKGVAQDVLIVGKPSPDTQAEVTAIAKVFHTQALTGNTATKTVVVQRMPQAKIIHLATVTIALPNDREGLGSGIALAPSGKDDGWLTSDEITNLHLQADLVVLSANNTATGKITGDGIIGLPRSFLIAGANSVIGSLWNVSDKETAFLMREFYQELSKNHKIAEALRHAMLVTIKSYPNSMNWAAFTLIGASD